MKKLTTTTLFLAVLLCSCSHYYYVTNVQNVPLFREKNEYRLSVTYGEGDESASAEVQAAYSVTDKIGVMTNFMSAKGGNVSSKNYGKGNYIDGAIGYYKPIGRSGVFEIYGGLGGSNQHHEYTSAYYNQYNGNSDLSFIKLFVQPSLGLTFNVFDLALSSRICSLSYININNNVYGNTDLYNELNTIANKNHLLLEPAVTLRGGWKYVKVQFQAAFANIFDKSDLYFVEQSHISIGLYVAIAERYK